MPKGAQFEKGVCQTICAIILANQLSVLTYYANQKGQKKLQKKHLQVQSFDSQEIEAQVGSSAPGIWQAVLLEPPDP
jgi:hypothetical protein